MPYSSAILVINSLPLVHGLWLTEEKTENATRETEIMANRTIGKSIIVHKDAFAYISHPSVACLDNGDWLAAFNHSRRREPHLHPPGDPLFRTLLARSEDHGATWSEPWFAPDFDWYGTECPGISRLSDGTVVLTQFRFNWYPLGLARKRWEQGERIAIRPVEGKWTEEIDEDDWSKSRFPWARSNRGVFAHLSKDRGETFESTVQIDCAPYREGYTNKGVRELSDGRLAYALTEHHPPYSRHTYVVFSNTNGTTWDPPGLVAATPEFRFGEPDIVEVGPGKLYCIMLSAERDASRPGSRRKVSLSGSRSEDGGQTWSEPEPTLMKGYPGQLLPLEDGRLICTYGYRKAPYGIRACLSSDGGRSWAIDDEIVIRDDLPNDNLGYPTTIEYEPGQLFCCYYGQTGDGVTCVQGTYLSLGD
jgi:hypothetical protein